MKNILIIGYSQTGQLHDILNSIIADIRDQATIDVARIEPETPFPFPWTAATFFDAMPESVLHIGSPIKPLPKIEGKKYDLVIFGFQPWFLSPSQPASGFLQSEWASVLRHTPVVTVVGCRNMWLNAMEHVKAALARLEARHCGLIVLEDRHSNLTSLRTIIKWMFSGKKAASGNLPEAGVSASDIQAAQRFGPVILRHLNANTLDSLQDELLEQQAVVLHPNLIVLEKRGISQFPVWARRARKKGGPADPRRRKVIRNFQRLLLLAIFVLSPVTSLIAKIKTMANRKKLMKEVAYYKSVRFDPKRLS